MPLQSGDKFGPYEVIAPIGAGGMGEVYRARDTRLGRDVALKVLPAEFAQHASRRERFEREAKTVAALNHPNIVALYDIGESSGQVFLVSELVDGETLRGAAISHRKAIDLAAQIADGLAAAHAAGVTHRDLKPDNVMVTADGRAKILDFGLAKIVRKSPSADVTATLEQSLTQAGTVMGTAGYMAPEQVRGEETDHRSDIFSFGALLQEMLSGARAFKGATAIETMNAVLNAEPPDLPDSVPVGVRELVRHCLAKKPAQRFQSAQDLAYALRAAVGRTAATTDSLPVLSAKTGHRVPLVTVTAAVVLVVLAVVAGVGQWTRSWDNLPEPIHLSRFAGEKDQETNPAFSPDGRSVAYMRALGRTTELVVQSIGTDVPVVLASAPVGFLNPTWTPDGTRICYSQRGVWCISASGGTPQRLLDEAASTAFTPDGKSLLLLRGDTGHLQLFVSSPPGSEPKLVEGFQLPPEATGIAAISSDGRKLLLSGSSLIRGSGKLWVANYPFDAKTGPPKDISIDGNATAGTARWFPDGRHIVYASLKRSGLEFQLMLQDIESGARHLVLADTGAIISTDLSRDGQHLMYSTGQPEWDIIEYSMDGKRIRPMVASSLMDASPSWSRLGDRFTYTVGGIGHAAAMWTRAADGSSPEKVAELLAGSVTYSPDGKRLAFTPADGDGIATMPVAGGRPVVIYPGNVTSRVCWSPDGEWIWFGENDTLRKVPSQGGPAVTLKDKMGRWTLLDCSPDGNLAYTSSQGLHILASDGKGDRLLSPRVPAGRPVGGQFGEGGQVFYRLRYGGEDWGLDVVDVQTGTVRRTIRFEVDPSDVINSFSVHPDGKRVLLTTGGLRYDLWMVEGFAQPATGWKSWFRHWEIPQPPATPDPTPAK